MLNAIHLSHIQIMEVVIFISMLQVQPLIAGILEMGLQDRVPLFLTYITVTELISLR